MLRIHELKLKPGESTELLPERILKKLGRRGLAVESWKIVKESIDARDKQDIRLVYTVDFTVTGQTEAELLERGGKFKLEPAPTVIYEDVRTRMSEEELKNRFPLSGRPVVAGFGPCGMFAALTLARAGYRPIVLERGKSMEQRTADVERFWKEGILDPESNVQFGEGGAGTFSDGKLTTQIRDPRVRQVLRELADAGGGEDLLYRQKPHIGTDVLREVVVRIRETIISLGGEVRFEHCLNGLEFDEKGALRAVEVCAGPSAGPGAGEKAEPCTERIETPVVILALGHSARDTVRLLHQTGIRLEQKPFSIGVRIEHPQAMVDRAQFGPDHGKLGLPAADYKLSWRCENGRGVYTFCMCPGGFVVGAASQSGGVVTNGMSYRDRGGANANSALLVDVRPSDFGSEDPLAGIEFQEKYERLAFELGGGDYSAPVQRVGDFMNSGTERNIGEGRNEAAEAKTAEFAGTAADAPAPTYLPGVRYADLTGCLPGFAVEAMREALPRLGRKLAGFDGPDGLMTGVETRSSSPVRILRGDTLESQWSQEGQGAPEQPVTGVYPGGEGAGYAGGIVSSAVDGLKIAEAIISRYQEWEE